MLADFVKAQMHAQGLKPVEVVRRSGKRISVSNVNKIASDLSGRITVQTADALSLGLRVPLIDVVLAALDREAETPLLNNLQAVCGLYPQLNQAHQQKVDYLLFLIKREIERLLDAEIKEVEQSPELLAECARSS